ncbi:amidohydrolase family protein [Saccharopolyspora erythraea]|uniref:amidohydrolase family protein n=1 Tax=Saccharopolyspora erythraea TaxID=1836 RepID=UPI001BABB94F|nr:amidohydrolase family protein [Saccharopolyspora erythraea]QUH03121.1 amidohydrolase family protein [Saccharopolyspora erythraea]
MTADHETIVLTGATVIDATGADPRPGTTVVLRGDRITEVGHRAGITVPDGARVVDVTGKYVIPGLADMHVHADGPPASVLPLYLANGVTTVRVMWGDTCHHEWRRGIESGELAGPRMWIGSRIVDGRPSLWRGFGLDAPFAEVDGAADARRAVEQAQSDGADFVKVYSRISAEDYLALAEEAGRRGIAFAGHCPDTVPITEAAELGQRSFEHLFGIWSSTSDQEPALRGQAAGIDTRDGGYNSWFQQTHALEWRAATTFDERKAALVFRRLAETGSAQVPTLVMHRILDMPELGSLTDERLRYLPPGTAAQWKEIVDGLYLPGRTGEESAQRRELFERRLRMTAALREAGVPVLAGTDVGTPFTFPGFSLHDELELLVRAGFTPMQALRAATAEPAAFLGAGELLGTVEPGRLADLVVLDDDPLRDIANTRRIHAVVARGRLLPARERARMLDDVAAAVRGEAAVSSRTCC